MDGGWLGQTAVGGKDLPPLQGWGFVWGDPSQGSRPRLTSVAPPALWEEEIGEHPHPNGVECGTEPIDCAQGKKLGPINSRNAAGVAQGAELV
jgi:hypothetical protein